MTGEDMQGMLFGTVEAPGTPAGDDPGQQVLRVCALNVNSAGTDRAQPLLEWLTGTRCNVLVLTELRPSDGGRLILAGLEADGFHVARTPGWQDSQYMAVDDAYRHLNPDGTDHSWASDRFGGQRLDHALISPAAGTIRECRYDHAPRTRRLTDHAALLITVGPDADR
jgi:exonuclease III